MRIEPGARRLIKTALAEDIGRGDITTRLTVPEGQICAGRFIAKGGFVLAGMPYAREVFRQVDPKVAFDVHIEDGARCKPGDLIAEARGLTASVLLGERVALNILQRLSGVATLTAGYVSKVKGLRVRVLDTRKTTPGMRLMEKYAVRAGGGHNHRFGLDDGILIKDNHIASAGGIGRAVKLVRDAHTLLKIEVEASTVDEVREALRARADVIMLDNMPQAMMRECVRLIRGRAVVEASGNVSLRNIRAIAATGVDCISVGSLTHSAPSADISLRIIAAQ